MLIQKIYATEGLRTSIWQKSFSKNLTIPRIIKNHLSCQITSSKIKKLKLNYAKSMSVKWCNGKWHRVISIVWRVKRTEEKTKSLDQNCHNYQRSFGLALKQGWKGRFWY